MQLIVLGILALGGALVVIRLALGSRVSRKSARSGARASGSGRGRPRPPAGPVRTPAEPGKVIYLFGSRASSDEAVAGEADASDAGETKSPSAPGGADGSDEDRF